LGEEGRVELHQLRVVAHQLGLEPARAHPVRDDEQRLQHLVAHAGAEHRVIVRSRQEEGPEAAADLEWDRREPVCAVGRVQDEADRVLERPAVEDRRQQPVGHAPGELGEEAGVRKDAAIGEEVGLLAALEEREEAAAQRGGVHRVRVDYGECEGVVCGCGRAPRRTDRGEERGEALGRLGGGAEEAPQGLVDPEARREGGHVRARQGAIRQDARF
jgi:hypothetical protein